MLKKVRVMPLTAFLAVVLMISVTAFAKNKNGNPTPVIVKAGRVHYQQIPDYASALGTLVAVRSTSLSFLSGGHLSQKLFKNGAKVKKNDVIAKLDDSTIESELASAKANMEEAQSKYDRYSLLKDSGVFSKQDYISVSTALKVAKAKYASVLEQEQQLTLLAPFEGTLGKYNFSVGAQVAAGDAIVNLVQLDPLKVGYSLNQTEKGHVHEGQAVILRSDIWPSKVFSGKVTYISPTINPNTGRFDLEAIFSNPHGKLSPGGLVHVEHILGKGHRALVVPQTSVSVNEDQSYVFTIINDKAHRVNVVTGTPMENGDIVITEGLKNGERIVIDGVQKLGDGTLVKMFGHEKKTERHQTEIAQKTTQVPDEKNARPVAQAENEHGKKVPAQKEIKNKASKTSEAGENEKKSHDQKMENRSESANQQSD